VGFAEDILLADTDTDTAAAIANVNFYCTTPGQVFNDDCLSEICEGSLTPDDLIMDIFNRCVYQETGANLDFNPPDYDTDKRKQALRTAKAAASAGANNKNDRSLRHICDACQCSEVFCMLGYCGSSCSCTCVCKHRRLEEENEILFILQGCQLQLTPDTTTEAV
jgi:hypothetical protein